ncbi:MAG: tRNA epoxyqueuosine(34) reductase QueG [Chitinophagales bacterium]|nr:tRNA epoxyqueuosine(34) reductase QueG [Chitinophagales bacterium]
MVSTSLERRTKQLKDLAYQAGFDFVGISKAAFLEDEAPKLENWLKRGFHGKMSYMENHFDKRLDPRKLVDGAKSIISLSYNYFPETPQKNDTIKIARYAYGKDYHTVIKAKLQALLEQFSQHFGQINGRIFVDSAPVMERQWAQKSGLGWLGKNTLLIHKQRGSYYFLAEIICDIELIPDDPIGDYCGKCTRCIDACPTDALAQPYLLDASKCISYLTIELKDEFIPKEFEGKNQHWAFGCDICQEVCPWNRFAKPHNETAFTPQPYIDFSTEDWLALEEEHFKVITKNTPLERTKWTGMKRNILFTVNHQK